MPRDYDDDDPDDIEELEAELDELSAGGSDVSEHDRTMVEIFRNSPDPPSSYYEAKARLDAHRLREAEREAARARRAAAERRAREREEARRREARNRALAALDRNVTALERVVGRIDRVRGEIGELGPKFEVRIREEDQKLQDDLRRIQERRTQAVNRIRAHVDRLEAHFHQKTEEPGFGVYSLHRKQMDLSGRAFIPAEERLGRGLRAVEEAIKTYVDDQAECEGKLGDALAKKRICAPRAVRIPFLVLECPGASAKVIAPSEVESGRPTIKAPLSGAGHIPKEVYAAMPRARVQGNQKELTEESRREIRSEWEKALGKGERLEVLLEAFSELRVTAADDV